MVKALIFFGCCNFRKGNYLRFCRESVSQCGGARPDVTRMTEHVFVFRVANLWPEFSARDV
jgi:hypothetical protein